MVQRGANYARQERDWYPTPPEPIHALMDIERFSNRLLDPCCGDGAFLRVWFQRGFHFHAADVHPIDVPEAVTADFLDDDLPFPAGFDILTNPPFGSQGKLAERFIRRAIDVVKPWSGKVCMLLPSDFDSAAGRFGLFGGAPAFARRVVMLNRIVWFHPEENSDVEASPSANFSWFLWDHRHFGPAQHRYISWR